MKRIELELSHGSEIIIKRCAGSLHLKGWDQEKARIDLPTNVDSYSQKGNQLIINTAGDCLMRVPVDVRLKVEKVGGDASISGIVGAVSLLSVGGSVNLKRVGSVTAEKISGNLNAKDLDDINIQRVHGNASLRNIHGEIIAEEVNGNLSIREASTKVEAHTSGNANLRLSPPPEADYKISCAGNAYCRVEGPINAKVLLNSKDESIFVYTDEGDQHLETKEHTLSFGEGKASIEIKAQGHIDFRSKDVLDDFTFAADINFGDGFGDVIDDISDQVGAQLEAQLEALNDQLESLSERMENSGDRAMQRAQRKVEAAQRSLESKLRARNLGARGRGPKAAAFAFPFAAAGEPVSEEERMKVLQMVQEKEISVEEAEMLLASLEGREAPKKKKE